MSILVTATRGGVIKTVSLIMIVSLIIVCLITKMVSLMVIVSILVIVSFTGFGLMLSVFFAFAIIVLILSIDDSE